MMATILAGLFTHPIELPFPPLWLLAPLSLAVAAVYKTIRTPHLRRLPIEIALVTLYILGGMGMLMLVPWLLTRLL